MALNTTPEEAKAIHELASKPAHKMSSKWITNEDGYRNANNRFLDSIRCALEVVSAEVSLPALEVNKSLASSFATMNPYTSDYSKIANEIEAEILGYAIEALTDSETLELFKSIANNDSITALDKC